MDERAKKEEKNKRIGWLTSVGVQLLLLMLFYFIIAWREPFPPIPAYGIELGFTSSAGATSNAPSRQVEPQEQEATRETVSETVENTPEETAPVEESITEPEVVTQEVPDVPIVEEEPSVTQEEMVEAPVTETIETVEEPQIEDRAVMKPSESDGEKHTENPGDSEEENQEIDSRAIYGSQGANTGSNEGASLALAGWVWDFKPDPKDDSDQAGKIVYKIVVDQDGYLVKIEIVTSTVSPAVERKYRDAVQKLTFSKTGDYQAAALSTGTVTFVIKSR